MKELLTTAKNAHQPQNVHPATAMWHNWMKLLESAQNVTLVSTGKKFLIPRNANVNTTSTPKTQTNAKHATISSQVAQPVSLLQQTSVDKDTDILVKTANCLPPRKNMSNAPLVGPCFQTNIIQDVCHVNTCSLAVHLAVLMARLAINAIQASTNTSTRREEHTASHALHIIRLAHLATPVVATIAAEATSDYLPPA